MAELREAGIPIDYLTLKVALERRRELQSIGGLAYLQDLTTGLPRRPTITQYVQQIKQKAALRTIIHACTAAISEATELGSLPEDCAGNLEKALTAANEWRPEVRADAGFFVGALTLAN
jgi:replicative DNA helicase